MTDTPQDGVTKSERHLSRLCRKSFLRLWSYPNAYQDKGKCSRNDEGNELCDLLVVCGDDVIIFSDKCCTFKDTGNLLVDWRRWFKNTIHSSARQVYGAERWILQHPGRLFLDPACTKSFPLPIPKPGDIRIHRIIVASGAKERCKREKGGSGSLAIIPQLKGSIDRSPQQDDLKPFATGWIDQTKGFIHVLDEVALEIVMHELDTITDFVEYFCEKEALIESGRLQIAAGEEELLAIYLKTVNDKGKHFFPVPNEPAAGFVVEEYWAGFRSSPQYTQKKNADKVSYFWDHIIETFTGHIIDKSLLIGNDRSLADNEEAFRILASENRFSRRVLSSAILEYHKTIPPGKIGHRTIKPTDQARPVYVYVAVPRNEMPEDKYREYRQRHLGDYCLVVASEHRQFKQVVGIATEAGQGEERSYDLGLTEVDEWTLDLEAKVSEIRKNRQMFTQVEERHAHYDEYPTVLDCSPPPPSSIPKKLKLGRNAPCPCGSGRKYKKCCLNNLPR